MKTSHLHLLGSAVALSAALIGCKHPDIMSPSHPLDGDLRNALQADANHNLLKWEAEYYGGESHNIVDDQKKQLLRDKIASMLVQLVDEYQREFNGKFYGRAAIGTSALEITGGGLSAAASVTTPPTVSKLLAAIGSGFVSANAILQKDIFQQKAVDVVLARIEVLRAKKRQTIIDGLKKNVAAYPLVEALADIAEYSNQGSLMAGLAAINGDTANQKAALK